MSFNTRQEFLTNASIFEFALLVVGMLLGWFFAVPPNEHVQLNAVAVAYGILSAFPLFLAFLAVEQLPIAPIQKIQEAVLDTLGNYLAQCTWLELALLASLAGIGEEVLFRGFLMAWVESLGGYWLGLIVSSVAFGLMHAITWTYTLFACLAGAYFGWLFDATGERNLIPPILCHTLYDFLAFLVIVRDVRQREATEADAKG